MGSVIDSVKCPICSNEDAYGEFYYKTGEEMIVCDKCGYHKTYFVKLEKRTGKIADIQPDWFELKEVANPYGCFKYKFKEDEVCSLSALETEDAMPSITEFVEKNKENLEYAKMSRFENGQIVETNMI